MFVSCNLNNARNIKDCKFTFNSISNVTINDISLDGKSSFLDFSPNEVVKLSQSLTTGTPITFTTLVNIDNPNDKNVEISALEWILLIKDVEVANGILDQKVKIKAKQNMSIPLNVKTNTAIFSNFSFNEVKSIIFKMSKTNHLPQNSVLKIKPAIKIGSKMIYAPNYFTIDLE